ncbi:phosphatase PAP2 family protein [Caenimonas sedimenti]|uniref:Phosphatase PAP2 family protein n=1 Tax=Caenimonas sedimenti TaxID=2596921 RepID=A0A562ZHK3_9BURK|nr:phosphatase PAP2 family protein [Caenimonas sedimenti]TWO68062.1 phosphatase PAP2 family protein [Caenimonas sedimenti]
MSVSNVRVAWASAGALAALIAWDVSGLDLELAHAFGTAQGFPLREHWFLTQVMHSGAKTLAWLAILALCIAVTWPTRWLEALPQRRRVQLAATALVASGLVTLIKAGSHTSCPWDLHEFGGIARHVSHWAGWLSSDGGAGRCFPAGHATTGFAFIGGYFALRHDIPRLAIAWLAGALVLGLLLGGGQQMRGAHFMSHTLWTGWICWMTAWLTDPLFARDRGTPLGEATA